MRNILVTGGAGFVGSHLCERLVKKENNAVWSLDNYFTGSESNHVSGVNYIRADTADISQAVTFKPDLVFHLGEYSRVEQSFDDIETVWNSNCHGTFRVLEFCRQNSSKLIYAGSSTKFGDNGEGKHQSPYAQFKAANTELVCSYGKWFDLDFAITYFYNVYGKREIRQGKYATLIAHFAECMRTGKKLTVVKPGSQKRSFTHVDDIIDGLVCVAEQGQGDGFGLGSSEEFSINEVAAIFGGEVEWLPQRRGNRMQAEILTEKTMALGWSPKRYLSDYIEALRDLHWEIK